MNHSATHGDHRATHDYSSDGLARYYVIDAARQLVADMDAIDYGAATDIDLCRLLGRTRAILGSLLFEESGDR